MDERLQLQKKTESPLKFADHPRDSKARQTSLKVSHLALIPLFKLSLKWKLGMISSIVSKNILFKELPQGKTALQVSRHGK